MNKIPGGGEFGRGAKIDVKAKYLEGRQNPVEEARAKAIEECAKIADSYRWNAFSQGHMPLAKAFEMLADDIRALIAGSTK